MAMSRIEICEKAKEALTVGKTYREFVDEMETKYDVTEMFYGHQLKFAWELEKEKLENDKYRSVELVVGMARRRIDNLLKEESNSTFARMKINKILHDYGFKES